jgi:hypothetical protein
MDSQCLKRGLGEAAINKMPKVLRNLFPSICVWSHPTDPLCLLNKYKQHLYEDSLHIHLNEAVASNLSYRTSKIFSRTGVQIEPENFEYDNYDLIINEEAEINLTHTLYKTLNINQYLLSIQFLKK